VIIDRWVQFRFDAGDTDRVCAAYAVFGDTGPKSIVGEASYAVTSALGSNPDPATGGVASGVTYIVFQGTTVAAPRSNASIARAGETAAARLVGGG
jgi:hypothetical protein